MHARTHARHSRPQSGVDADNPLHLHLPPPPRPRPPSPAQHARARWCQQAQQASEQDEQADI
ncbi:hypothetical protein EJ05DRAFT_472759 [Pseudovirgaria hyperparasitica]|uniref:Uncharacterized protein n=1 Tax=Pseudovirgaria hyperparasitica TaxID=470096 RepID=A0A6A6WG74_9PEZI|nr:uncharacterized protein EJ05DRAFT_472759 [Pseudovirgaria hyperparasitica]KAF2761798.1 hypothetical protein EJ05DRAFT_472759 [Pseudovirgaria hyperparasitica]